MPTTTPAPTPMTGREAEVAVDPGRPLAGRVCVVVGAGRGIGRALSVVLAGAGATMVLSSRTESELQETAGSISAGGSAAAYVVADATVPDGARAPVRAALERHGRLDILVNNVGGFSPVNHDPLECDPDVVERELGLNLLPAWHASHEALPAMTAQGFGRIINIGSGSSRFSGARLGYTVAKHALVGLTISLAAAVGTRGITVNCVCPGWVDTSLHDWSALAQEFSTTPERVRAYAARQAMQNRILAPGELAGMAVLLASPVGGRAITGQVIAVDGGYRI